MGTILDTTVFITLERAVRTLPQRGAMAEVGRRLEATLGPAEDVGIAAITASELLHGVHRATPEHRARREAFVEAVPGVPADLLDLLAARAYARLWAALASAGTGRTSERTTASLPPRPSPRAVRRNGERPPFCELPGLDVVDIELT